MEDRAVEIRIEALRAASKVAMPGDGAGSLIANARWLADFLETGKTPEAETVESERKLAA